jgi:hypothetical protein
MRYITNAVFQEFSNALGVGVSAVEGNYRFVPSKNRGEDYELEPGVFGADSFFMVVHRFGIWLGKNE